MLAHPAQETGQQMAQPQAPRKPLRSLTFSIMCVGDSITTGCEPLENAYRADLLSLLDSSNKITYIGPATSGSMHPSTQNRIDARMGRKIYQTRDALERSLPTWKPDVILLHTGTNDVVPHEVTPERLVEQIDSLLQYIRDTAPQCTTLVALIIPAAFRLPQICAHNEKVRAKVEARKERGEKFVAVDMVDRWPDDAFVDIAHPNAKGFKYMAEKWRNGLEVSNGLGWLGEEDGDEREDGKSAEKN